MPNKFLTPTRMCVNCRDRQAQCELIRLSCKNKTVVKHNGIGRSFYICLACIDDKKLKKSLSRQCKTNLADFEKIVDQLREIAANERKNSN